MIAASEIPTPACRFRPSPENVCNNVKSPDHTVHLISGKMMTHGKKGQHCCFGNVGVTYRQHLWESANVKQRIKKQIPQLITLIPWPLCQLTQIQKHLYQLINPKTYIQNMFWHGIQERLRPPRPLTGDAAACRTPLQLLREIRPLTLPL